MDMKITIIVQKAIVVITVPDSETMPCCTTLNIKHRVGRGGAYANIAGPIRQPMDRRAVEIRHDLGALAVVPLTSG